MKTIVTTTANAYTGSDFQYYQFTIYQSGSRRFLEVTTKKDQWSEGDSFIIEMCRDERKVQVEDSFLEQTDLFRQMADMVKNSQGMWQPKFEPGDLIMVDKPGSSSVKVIDPNLQTSETLEKKQVIIDQDQCQCGLKTLMQLGCAKKRGKADCEWDA